MPVIYGWLSKEEKTITLLGDAGVIYPVCLSTLPPWYNKLNISYGNIPNNSVFTRT